MTTRVPPAPGRQRADALISAQTRRLAIVEERRRIRKMTGEDARARVQSIVADKDGPLNGAKVGDLLKAIRGIGPSVAVPRILRHAGVWSMDTAVRSLTDRQRTALVFAIGLTHCEQLRLVHALPRSEEALQREIDRLHDENVRLRRIVAEMAA